MGMGRCWTGACSGSLNRWRDRRVIVRLRVRLSVLRLWLRLSRLRLWLRIRPGLCHVRLWLPGLWLWLWDRLLRRLQIRLSPRYPPPYLRLSSRPASLALLKSRPDRRLCCDDFRPGDDAESEFLLYDNGRQERQTAEHRSGRLATSKTRCSKRESATPVFAHRVRRATCCGLLPLTRS